MNMATYSSIITLLYAWALLWMTMDVRFRDLTTRQKWLVPLLTVFLAAVNQTIRVFGGSGMLSRLLPLTMHLPVFLIFLHLTKCGVIKMAFMILTALVFSAPIVMVTTYCKRVIPLNSPLMLLINLATSVVMLLLVYLVFRRGFHYLLKYGDNKLLARFCLVPLLYYIYVFAVANVDLAGMTSVNWLILRSLPSLNVYLFYFMLLYNYRELSLRHELETARAALSMELDAAEEQLALLEEAYSQSAIYRHDMRHHLTAINAFLAEGDLPQAEDLPLSDTEVCALLSNGLENALNAAAGLEEADRWISFFCGVRVDKLLLEIRNPYRGGITLRDGLPAAGREGHGHGCRSIRTIAERRQGLYVFQPEDGIFTLRIALPL